MNASHFQRWITAVIAVPILISLIYLANASIFAVIISIVIAIAAWEYEGIIISRHGCKRRWEFIPPILIIPVAMYLADSELLKSALVFSILLLILCDLYRTNRLGTAPEMGLLSQYVLGVFYLPLLMSHFILIRLWEQGIFWVFYVLLIAFAGDVAAYYTGRLLGKTKLCPTISPNKTNEGVVGLVLGAVLASGVYGHIFFPQIPLVHMLMLAFLASIIGQLGDLFESEIKRSTGVKDSGVLLPGHGGMLDRIDCMVLIAPFVYYYKTFLIG
jgi:phosphatidate cytidylyltransferase